MTRILNELNWPKLEMRREYLRLQMFSKILNNTVEIELPSYVKEQSRQTRSTETIQRNLYLFQYQEISTNFSFFPGP